MLNWLQSFRERGWHPIEEQTYAAAWHKFGGSVITHPEFVGRLSELVARPPRYLGCSLGNELVGAVATWGRFLSLSRKALKQMGKRHLFDLGNAEVILPLRRDIQIPFRFEATYLSEQNLSALPTLRRQKESIALLRSPNDFGKKFLYNQRRELRLFEERGGTAHSIHSLAPEELASTYRRLFELRWGFATPAGAALEQVFALLHPYMTGSLLRMDGRPIAIQILYRVEAPEWISIEYINGGVDPAFQSLSPGSILTFINTQDALRDASERHKPLRYSFGRADRDYKMRWCRAVPVFRT